MCTCELQFFTIVATLTNIIITNITDILLNIKTVRLEIYSAKGPLPKAVVAPCTPVAIAHCSKL